MGEAEIADTLVIAFKGRFFFMQTAVRVMKKADVTR